jgi:hypothetical protein
MPDPTRSATPELASRQAIAEHLRDEVRQLELHVMVGGDNDLRTVEDRNRVDRPRLIDVVKLDDIWQILDDFGSSRCYCPFPNEDGYVREWCPVHDPDGTYHAEERATNA